MELSDAILKTVIDAGIGVLAIVALVFVIRLFNGDSQRNDELLKQVISLMAQGQENTKALTKAIENNTEVVRGVADIPQKMQEQQTENTTQIKAAILSMSNVIKNEQHQNREWSNLVDTTLGIFTDRFDRAILETTTNRDLNSAAQKLIIADLKYLKSNLHKVERMVRLWLGTIEDIDLTEFDDVEPPEVTTMPSVDKGDVNETPKP